MRIEVHVPVDTNPDRFDDLMMEEAKKHGYVLMRRSGMPVDFTATIVVERGFRHNINGDQVSPDTYLALSADLYKLREGETS